MRQGDQRAALAYYQEALIHFRAIGDYEGIALVCSNLGHFELEAGNLDAALVLLRESLALRRAFGDSRWLPTSLNLIAVIALRQGHLETALALLDESLAHCRQFVDQHAMIKHTLEVLARATSSTGARVWTAEIHGAIARLDQITPREPWDQPAYEQQLAADQTRLDPLSWQLAWDKGYGRDMAAMLAVANEFCHTLRVRHAVTAASPPPTRSPQRPASQEGH